SWRCMCIKYAHGASTVRLPRSRGESASVRTSAPGHLLRRAGFAVRRRSAICTCCAAHKSKEPAMPLSPPPERELLHSRDIVLRGYRRSDGLYDIEAHLTDTKTYGSANRDRGYIEAGEPIHGM